MIDLQLKEIEKKIFDKGNRKIIQTLFHRKSYRFKSSKMYAVCGPKKSGKSMLLRLIIRLNDLDHGNILFNGAVIQQIDLIEFRQYFSASLPGNHFFSDRVDKEMAFTAKYISDIPQIYQKNRVSLLCSLILFPQEKLLDNPIDLSQEEKSKIKISRTLFGNADCFIFDEAFDELKVKDGIKILNNLKTICRQEEKLIIFSSNVPEFSEIADEVIELKIID